jgi:uncharacterized protein
MNQNASMEEILSSIRSSLEEETAKVGQAAAAQPDADVLNLSELDIAPEAPAVEASEDDLIDLEAFAMGGQVKPLEAAKVAEVVSAPLVVAEEPVAEEAAGADVLADLEENMIAAAAAPIAVPAAAPAPAPVTPSGDPIDDLLAELGGTPAESTPEADTVEPEPLPEVAAAPARMHTPPYTNGHRLELAAFDTHQGLQLGLPAEVLAAALRPMVGAWLQENLPGVVERLVKDEIAKLTNQ